jgi:DNA-binding response OmpR family regulator
LSEPLEEPIATEPGTILIVDDEENIRAGLQTILSRDGHQVRDAANGEEAIRLLETFDFEVAVVDIRMPGLSGVELLHEIRNRWPAVSVILLTGHGTLETAITAVKEGAYDYLLKPAQPEDIRKIVKKALVEARRRREQDHLLASLQTSLKRLGVLEADSPLAEKTSHSEKKRITIGDLQINLQAYEVRRNDVPISLTPSEFQLLVTLASRPGEVIDYNTLVKMSLDYEAEPWEAKELIKRHIFSLRQKIELKPSSPEYILNVRGVGYRIANFQDSD